MRQVFLVGDVSENFASVSAAFVAAAGGHSARIALLTTGGAGALRYLSRYRDAWLALGAAEVTCVLPSGDGAISAPDAEQIATATGIFMGGGPTPTYQRLYAQTPVGELIRARYVAGIPYGGASAGALLATETAILAGDRVTTAANEYRVRAVYPEPQELQLGRGLGLLRNGVVEAHLAERGSFPRLISALARAGARWGLGLDEPACVHIVDEEHASVLGRGRAYFVRAMGDGGFCLRVLDPGDRFSLAE